MKNLNFEDIKHSKNLLAFSAGIDSTALFFLLLEKNIDFDIAIVDYNIRLQSKEEVKYAQYLAKKYNKKIFLKEVKSPILSNFEKNARDIRYTFFEKIIKENFYAVLVMAHQLNDKLEWFLMQASKGAGLVELLGLKTYEKRENYKIYRPLLDISKEELENYLLENKIKYFIDETNLSDKYKRNYFRHNFSDEFLKNFENGVKNTFHYLEQDLNSLNIKSNPLIKIKELEIFENTKDDNLNIRIIDLSLKKRGILLSFKQREEIVKQKELVISHKFAISLKEDFIYIAPYENTSMDKKAKELYRTHKIPKNIRPYLYLQDIHIDKLKT